MDRDFLHLKTGGKTDPVYAKYSPFHFPAVKPDRILKDGSAVSLGNIRMTARLGAGHTAGATTWITTVKDGGRDYRVVFPCCTGVNPNFGPIPGHQLVGKPSYPGILEDYRRTFRMLASLRPQIWLGAHTESFDFEARRLRAVKEGVRAWVDPDGYRTWLAQEKITFERTVAKQSEKLKQAK